MDNEEGEAEQTRQISKVCGDYTFPPGSMGRPHSCEFGEDHEGDHGEYSGWRWPRKSVMADQVKGTPNA